MRRPSGAPIFGMKKHLRLNCAAWPILINGDFRKFPETKWPIERVKIEVISSNLEIELASRLE